MVRGQDPAGRRPGCARGRCAPSGTRRGRTAGGSRGRSSTRPSVDAARAGAVQQRLSVHASDTDHRAPSYTAAVVLRVDADRPRTHDPRRPGRAARPRPYGRLSSRWTVASSAWPTTTQELLGKLVTRGPVWPVAGVALHLANGAALRRAVRQPRAAPAPALMGARAGAWPSIEHLATWPLTVAGRPRPPRARRAPRRCGATAAAFAQATWRHVLFGAVLGELERRLNAPRTTWSRRPTSTSSPATATATSSTPWALRRPSRLDARYARRGPCRSSSAGRAPLL